MSQEFERLKQTDEKAICYLKKLNIFYSSLLSIHTLPDLFPTFERELSKVLDCEQTSLLLIEANYSQLNTRRGCLGVGRGLVFNIIQTCKPLIIIKSEELPPILNELSTIIPISTTYYRNIIAIPLLDIYNKIKAIIIGANKIDGSFNEDDQIFLGQLQEPVLTIINRIQVFNEKMKRYLFLI